MSYDPWETPPEERKARFVGREALLERLLSRIAEQEGHRTVQHYLLLGPRGIGKTTLLLTLRDRIRESPTLSARWFCVQLREEEYFIRTLRDLLELVLRALAEDEDLPDATEVAEQVHQEKREERSLAVAVEGLRSLAARHGRRILLLIDNFDRLFPATAAGRRKTRPAENEFRAFRKLLSKESFLMVVGASVRLFEEIAAYDQAFFNFFSPVEIPNLSEDEICELLRKCAELEKNTAFLAQFEAQRDKVRAITYLTGGNPRLVLMLYDVLRHREMTPVVEALRETVGGLTPLLKHVLDDMPRQQSKTLDALVRLRGAAPPNEIASMARLPLNVVTAQLGRLKEARFVVVEGEGKGRPATYRVSDPMFHTWYQMRYLRPAGRRIELFVEFIRAWFSVEERRQFLDELWRVLGDNGSRGLRGYASQEASLAIRHYAFALEDKGERQEHIGRLADAYVEAGKWREAAMLLAESAEPAAMTERQYECAAYRLLGDRMLEKGRHSEAIAAYRDALNKELGDVEAILGLGVCLESAGEHARAASEFQRVIDLPGAPAKWVAVALVSRGVARGSLGDGQGAIADYTAAVDLPGAPAIAVAMALVNRGIAKRSLEDGQGAIADYTAAVDLPGAPADQLARALVNRGFAFVAEGDQNQALSDFQSAADMPGVSLELRGSAVLGSGAALTVLYRLPEAAARFEECLGLRASAESVHGAFDLLIRIHLGSGKLEDAARLIARLHEFEPAETPIEQRLEARIGAITTAGKEHTPETAALLLDAALKSGPEEIRVRMEFLAPAIQYARTGDEQALARLPERERDMAKQIAAVIMGRQDRVEMGH
jgi:tetratricopeptide (TPR) repeat protein